MHKNAARQRLVVECEFAHSAGPEVRVHAVRAGQELRAHARGYTNVGALDATCLASCRAEEIYAPTMSGQEFVAHVVYHGYSDRLRKPMTRQQPHSVVARRWCVTLMSDGHREDGPRARWRARSVTEVARFAFAREGVRGFVATLHATIANHL